LIVASLYLYYLDYSNVVKAATACFCHGCLCCLTAPWASAMKLALAVVGTTVIVAG